MDFTDVRVRQFTDGLAILDQEMKSKLRAFVQEMRTNGKDLSVDNMTNSNLTMNVVTDLYADTAYTNSTLSRRVATMIHYFDAELVPSEILLEILSDPRPGVAELLAARFNRTMDSVLIDAAIGSAATGEAGAGSSALPTAQKIAHGSAALTLAKIKQVHKIMQAGHVDLDRDPVAVFVDSEGYEDLVTDTGVVSHDYVEFKTNQTGALPMLAGMQIISAEALNFNTYTNNSTSTTNRLAVAMAKSALVLGLAQDMSVEVDKATNKRNNYQIAMKSTFGAVRRHDARVVDIRFQ